MENILPANTLSREERLRGKINISTLLGKGKWSSCSCFKYCVLCPNGLDFSRIMISVPKRLFKRAVKRNLLKRRIREAYRTQKSVLGETHADILFQYNTTEILSSSQISEIVLEILNKVSQWEVSGK